MSKNLWRVGEIQLNYVKDAIETGLTGALIKRFESMEIAEKKALILSEKIDEISGL